MKIEGWESILFEQVKSDYPFEWGVKDCALYVADLILSYTGIDYAEPFRGKYKTQIGAARALIKYGHGGLEQWCNHNFESIPPKKARRGDCIMHMTERGFALGVCIGDRFAAQGENGTKFTTMEAALKAWRVE
jgi:hypothetical protein